LNSVQAASVHPHLRRRKVSTPVGEIDLIASSERSTSHEPPVLAVPSVGEHSQAIRAEFEEN